MKRFGMFVLTVSFALAMAACSKDETAPAAKPAPAADKPADKPAPTPAAAPADKPAAAAPAPAADKPAAAGAEDPALEAKAIELMGKLGDMFDADKADCDKLAGDLTKFIADNKDVMVKMKEYGDKQTPEQKKAFDEKHKGDMEGMMKKMTPAIQACGSNQKVQDAMKTMPM